MTDIASTRGLTETDLKLIRDRIQDKIEDALLRVFDNSDGRSLLETPKDYFFIEQNNIYATPAVFIVPTNMDFLKTEKGANHINAVLNIRLGIVNQDRDVNLLALKSFRFQAAMHEILDGVSLTGDGGDVKIVIKVMSAEYSPVFTQETAKTAVNDFRQEVSLLLEVNHFEVA